ncbi:hypothetical protein [Candidatus Raskinella chloraquaticus]|uniref:Uncharacterized protein n=1 Tax=Candidatus Raskinella chloraquaticus TaxID=1951219 RepID=A0A1W9HWQ4_9HYPH|nr:MAG: hypothetical protein A4S15_10820 [Proteobacteria bacterium SG_bin8]
MTLIAASFEANFRTTVSALLRSVMRSADIEAEVAADLVLLDGVSQGALWRRNRSYEFVAAAPVRDDVAVLEGASYPDRAAFVDIAKASGINLQLTPIRF